MNYYLLVVKFGHVKKNYSLYKEIPIAAENGKEAAKRAINMARVKHHKKDVIKSIKKINKNEYLEELKKHRVDKYFQVTSVQEQRSLCPEVYEQAVRDELTEKFKKNVNQRRRLIDEETIKEITKYKSYLRDYD